MAVLIRSPRANTVRITDYAPGDTSWHVVPFDGTSGHANWPAIDANLGGGVYEYAVIRVEASGGGGDGAGGLQWLGNNTAPSGTGARVSTGGQAQTLPNGLRCIAVKMDNAADHCIIETGW